MSDNIKVVIKVRPLIKREIDEKLPTQWLVAGNNITQIDPETKKKCETEYSFDSIFNETATNLDVFNGTIRPIVEAAMQGFNGTIFAYGQTSSGKTYTMMGTKDEPGVIPLAVTSIFEYIKKDQTRQYVLSVSYLELYNERINDLLDSERKDLKVREENGEIKVDCKEEVTHSVGDIMRLMKKGDKNRSIGETNMNERSSRSHTIFKISISSVLKTNADGDATIAQLNLIDLAGSERARSTGATGLRFDEGRHINMSLSTLGLVIKQLSEYQARGAIPKHINYRDSKLTRILQPSLGGNAMTTIICAVTPAAGEETACTLAFAQRAKGIKNKPQVNETGSDAALVKRFHKRIAKLNQNLIEAHNKIAATEEEKQHELEVLRGRIELLQAKILSGVVENSEKNLEKGPINRRRTWAGKITVNSPTLDNFIMPTIPEGLLEIDEDDDDFIKRRQSVFRSVKLSDPDESFSTDAEDFEIQLIKDEQERMDRWSTDSVHPAVEKHKHVNHSRRVRFEDENDDTDGGGRAKSIESTSVQTTPPKESNLPSPGTPKSTLRENLNSLRTEYQKLREYTTLEKQLCLEDPPPDLEFIKKSLADTELVYKDVSKKYAELQSEHNLLKQNFDETTAECKRLRDQVAQLTSVTEFVPTVEAEKNHFKAKFNEAQKRLQILEDETASHAYAMELIITKHKAREQELETSLNSAWEELNVFKSSDKTTNDNENHKLKAQIDEIIKNNEKLNSERINNYEKILNEKNNKITEFSEKCLEFEENLMKNQKIIENLEREVERLGGEVKSKNLEISELKTKIMEERDMEKVLEEKNKEMENLRITLEKETLQFTKKLEDFEKERGKREEEITLVQRQLEDKVQEKTTVVEALEKKIEGIEMEKREKCCENEKLKENLQKLEKNLQELEISENKLKEKVGELEAELDSVKSTEKLKLQEKEAELECSTDNFTKKIQELEEELNSLKSSEENLELLEKKFQEKEAELESSTENFTKKIQELEEELNSLKSAKIPETQEFLEKEIQENSQELKSRVNPDDESQSPENLKVRISDLEKSLESAKLSLDLLEKDKLRLIQEIDELRMKKPQQLPRRSRSIIQSTSIQNNNSMMSDRTLSENDSSVLENMSYFDSTLETSIAPTDSVFTNMSMNQTSNLTISDQSVLQESQLATLEAKEPKDLVNIIKTLDTENRKLLKEIQMKITETEEIKNDIGGFKAAVQLLNDTVQLLNNENTELGLKLTSEKEQNEEIKRSFEEQLKGLMEEKKSLENLNKTLNNSIDPNNTSGIIDPPIASDEARMKIESLTQENLQLSEDLMEKIEELEQLKKNLDLKTERIKNLELENVDLSNDLMEKIEEYETAIKKLKEETAKIGIEASEIEKIDDDKSIVTKIDMDTSESAKIEEDTSEKVKIEEKPERVEESTMTENHPEPCKKCDHLTELLKTRRLLKHEVKSADKKLMNLKEDFEQKSASAEKLQTKVKEDLNVSGFLNDTIFNGSILEIPEDTDTVTYVEEKVQKLHSELESIKSNYDQLTILYQDKCSEIDNLSSSDMKIHRISEELQKHREDLAKFKKYINNVSNALEKFKVEKINLEAEIGSLKEEKLSLEEKISSTEKIYSEESAKFDENLKSLQEELNILKKENEELASAKVILESEISSLTEKIGNEIDNMKIEELEIARADMKKEILSLKPNAEIDESETSASDLFRLFIQTIMAKEQEIIQKIQATHSREKRKLEEETRQLADAEKRSGIWAKELEADIERLQNDIADRETKNSSLQAKILKLENRIKEVEHEKKLMEEKVSVMEVDYVTLQSDLDKYRKRSSLGESKALIPQEEVDKLLHESILNKSLEHSNKLHEVEEKYKARVEELENSLECLKTKNLELRNTIEGLEANEKNSKAIIDLKSIELEKNTGIIDRLEIEIKKLTEDYHNLTEENHKNLEKIEEVTQLLKTKCDKLSECKSQLEAIKPDYEKLRDESREDKSRLEKYKTELLFFRTENEEHIRNLFQTQDSLEAKKIEADSLQNQLDELIKKHACLRGDLEQLQTRYDAVKEENDRLERKIRNSTSKLTAQRDLEDLQDENNTLKKNLEGASNRISELQAIKTQLAMENGDLKTKIVSLTDKLKDNEEALHKMADLEVKCVKIAELEVKCAKIAELEVECAKMADLKVRCSKMAELEAQIIQLSQENNKLKTENKELDDEMNDMLERMNSMDRENVAIETELHNLKQTIKVDGKIEHVDDTSLRQDLDRVRKELECCQMKCDFLTKENTELKNRSKDPSFESRSTSSSRSTSPTPSINSRRKRRSDLFNQNRPRALAEELEVAADTQCNCDTLRKKINDLELELTCKRGKISALEMKIESSCAPYKTRCKDYEEMLAVLKSKNVELRANNKLLEERLYQVVDCEKCKKRDENRRDAAVQAKAEPSIGFAAPRTGVVESEKRIAKLERDREDLVKLANTRLAKLKELTKDRDRLKQRAQACTCISGDSQLSDMENTKENIPSNVLSQPKATSSKYFQFDDC